MELDVDYILLNNVKVKTMNKKSRKRQPQKKGRKMTPHPCNVCTKIPLSREYYKDHMKKTHDKHICYDCNRSFKDVISYTHHLQVHSDDGFYSCFYCDFKTEIITDITVHIEQHVIPEYKCKHCKKVFNVRAWHEEHEIYCQNKELQYSCMFCDKKFECSRYLALHGHIMHKEEFEPKPFICPICKKQFKHRNSLPVHMRGHLGDKPICDVCGKQLSSREKLMFHMRVHTGYKPFQCNYCTKTFTKKTFMKEHERVHTGERPYVCSYCGKAFTQRPTLVIHERTHTGKKPYVCHLCNKGFVARAILNTHLKSCEGC